MNNSCLCVLKVWKSKFQCQKEAHICVLDYTSWVKTFKFKALKTWVLLAIRFSHITHPHCVYSLHIERIATSSSLTHMYYVTHSIQESKCALKVPVQQCPVSHARCSPSPLRLRQCCCCSSSTASQPTALPGIIQRWFSFFRQQRFDPR